MKQRDREVPIIDMLKRGPMKELNSKLVTSDIATSQFLHDIFDFCISSQIPIYSMSADYYSNFKPQYFGYNFQYCLVIETAMFQGCFPNSMHDLAAFIKFLKAEYSTSDLGMYRTISGLKATNYIIKDLDNVIINSSSYLINLNTGTKEFI